MNINSVNSSLPPIHSPETSEHFIEHTSDFFDNDPDLCSNAKIRIISFVANEDQTAYTLLASLPWNNMAQVTCHVEVGALEIRVVEEVPEDYEYHRRTGISCCFLERVPLPFEADPPKASWSSSAGNLKVRIPVKTSPGRHGND